VSGTEWPTPYSPFTLISELLVIIVHRTDRQTRRVHRARLAAAGVPWVATGAQFSMRHTVELARQGQGIIDEFLAPDASSAFCRAGSTASMSISPRSASWRTGHREADRGTVFGSYPGVVRLRLEMSDCSRLRGSRQSGYSCV
jgi:hypothetical protein